VFAPSNDAVEKAQAIVAAWDDAQRQGLGVVVVNGRLVEALHVIEAQRVLELRTAVIARNG